MHYSKEDMDGFRNHDCCSYMQRYEKKFRSGVIKKKNYGFRIIEPDEIEAQIKKKRKKKK